MYEIRQTRRYARWFRKLRDPEARARVLVGIRRLSLRLPTDTKSVGAGVHELRLHFGPGYRVYFKRRNDRLTLLLAAGDKDSQVGDIEAAKRIAAQIEGDR